PHRHPGWTTLRVIAITSARHRKRPGVVDAFVMTLPLVGLTAKLEAARRYGRFAADRAIEKKVRSERFVRGTEIGGAERLRNGADGLSVRVGDGEGPIADPQRPLGAAELAKELRLFCLDVGWRTDGPTGEPDEIAVGVVLCRLDFEAEIGGAIRE